MKRSLVVAVTMSLAVLAFLFAGCKKEVKQDPEAQSVILTNVGSKDDKALEKVEIQEGKTFVIRVKTDPLNAKVKSMTSSDESIATVDINTNTITGIKKGSAKITVAVGRNNLEASLLVSVTAKPGKTEKPADPKK